jgi:hypothetical protein
MVIVIGTIEFVVHGAAALWAGRDAHAVHSPWALTPYAPVRVAAATPSRTPTDGILSSAVADRGRPV